MHNLPKWIYCDPPEQFDIALLRPATLPKGNRFETELDVYETVGNYIIPNLDHRLPHIARKIANCGYDIKSNAVKNCLFPICPICARHYRRFFISEALRIYAKRPNGAQTATVYLETIEAGKLKDVSLKTAHARFRKQLQRCGFSGAIIIGGTEVTYRHELNDWLLHLHLFSLGASLQAWDNLEKLMAKYDVRDPLRRKAVQYQDHIDQLSYLQKFHTYYRASTPNGNKPARPVPLKKPQLCELASWASNHDFTDFTFCFGAQKRHGSLWVRTEAKEPITRP